MRVGRWEVGLATYQLYRDNNCAIFYSHKNCFYTFWTNLDKLFAESHFLRLMRRVMTSLLTS